MCLIDADLGSDAEMFSIYIQARYFSGASHLPRNTTHFTHSLEGFNTTKVVVYPNV
jgi:hypothetical protein